jgi:hypothetical protein
MPSIVCAMLGIALASVGLAGCGSSHTAKVLPGSAFGHIPLVRAGLTSFRPGTRFSLVYAYLQNSAAGPVTLKSIQLVGGHGLGTNIKMQKLMVVPQVPNGIHAVPETEYETDPPVYQLGSVCHIAPLRPIRGYVIAPNSSIRLYALFVAETAGSWVVPFVRVSYTLAHRAYIQKVRTGVSGGVSKTAKPIGYAPFERHCLTHTTGLLNR